MALPKYTQVERREKSNVGKGKDTSKEKCRGRNKNGVWRRSRQKRTLLGMTRVEN